MSEKNILKGNIRKSKAKNTQNSFHTDIRKTAHEGNNSIEYVPDQQNRILKKDIWKTLQEMRKFSSVIGGLI